MALPTGLLIVPAGRGTFTTTLTAFGPAGKDGFTGYDPDSARGSLASTTFYKGVSCTYLGANTLADIISIEFSGIRTQGFFYSLNLPTIGLLLAANATFDNNGGAGPSVWTWAATNPELSSGTVTVVG